MRKEAFEWICSRQDHNDKNDLPRVLLIGDSITRGYESIVTNRLRGSVYVDYLATSYAIDSKSYYELIKSVYSYNQYDLVHFNNGLHGIHVAPKIYEKKLEKMIKLFAKSKVVIALTTHLFYEGKNDFEVTWLQRVAERNKIMLELSKKYGLNVDDLYTISSKFCEDDLYGDGVHFLSSGCEILSDFVEKSIRENLGI
jgi:lysophospholipase L1-like esterase